MTQHPSIESFESFCRRLHELSSGDVRNWIASAETDSTSSQARRVLRRWRGASPEAVGPCAFVAWSQTGGRGRQGRSWASAPGLGLYVTFALIDLPPRQVRRLPMAIPIVVAQVIRAAGVEARIKWPNDLRCDKRKLAGILIEASSRGKEATDALVGIGINVHHDRETLPLPATTSLDLEADDTIDMARLAAGLGEGVSAFERSSRPLAELTAEYRSWSEHAPGDRLRCRRGDELVEGDFVGFDENGALQLAVEGGVLEISSSEIVEP